MTRIMTWVAVSLYVSGCAGHPLRFEDAPIVWYDDDDRDVPAPKARKFVHIQYFVDIIVFRRLTRALALRDLEPARNTNALDELPNSTWFTNRIGVRAVTPKEAARGPSTDDPPQLPLVVIDGKTGGRNPGFMARDARGREFLIKLDYQKNPDMQTGNDVIVSRLFWAIGYNVASQHPRLLASSGLAPRSNR